MDTYIVAEETRQKYSKDFPYWDKWEKRKVLRMHRKDNWYKIGDVLTVKHFGTFGCFDIENRWIDYYDLSPAIVREISPKEKIKLINEELLLIQKAKSELREWDDIPLSWQYTSICDILKIQNDNAGKSFCMNLIIGDSNKLAEELYESRGHEYRHLPPKKTNFFQGLILRMKNNGLYWKEIIWMMILFGLAAFVLIMKAKYSQ